LEGFLTMHKGKFEGDKEKFDADWELVNKIDGMAIEYLEKGNSPIETQFIILNSDVYQEWISIERCFAVHFHDISRFEVSESIGLLEFLALFTNNASGLMHLEYEQLVDLKEKETLREQYKSEFILKYTRA
jgi:hypothetical protein